ncbi:MAG: FAD synthetase family protein [Spirochaetales bacterium]|nr:FAD synthetase family protein [Spirochaetales bacterium]
MKLTAWSERINNRLFSSDPHNATIGVFDGIHLGHQRLLRRLAEYGEKSLVVTFRNNPKEVLRPELFGGHLISWDEKLRWLETLGVDEVLWIDFSPEFATMTAEEFLETLQELYFLRNMVLGWNFRLGRHPGLGVDELKRLFKKGSIEVIEPVFYQQVPVSSSEVRKAVHSGHLPLAARLLGRPYRLEVPEVEYHSGGFWAPRKAWNQVLPKPGKYPIFAGQKSVLTVEKDGLFWESPPDTVAKEIIFEE